MGPQPVRRYPNILWLATCDLPDSGGLARTMQGAVNRSKLTRTAVVTTPTLTER